MAGNIDEPKSHSIKTQKSESQVDGDTAALFFFQAIRMGAGESFHQSGFSMIDMSGSADNYMPDFFHGQNAIRTLMLAKAVTTVKCPGARPPEVA
jgi:hypothetical protein